MYDLKITGGTVVDGTGADRFRADIGVKDGRIVEVRRLNGNDADLEGEAADTLDATGRIVAPGFVDIHTHYDGQVSWDPLLEPSSLHGVTTVVGGNCGVGFAPVTPGREQWLIELMEGVEDIPGSALAEGITWQWESFPEYLDAIEKRPLAVDGPVADRARGGEAERARFDAFLHDARHRRDVLGRGRLVTGSALPHGVGADGAVRDLAAHVDGEFAAADDIEVLGVGLPAPGDALGERGARDVLDALHQFDEPLFLAGPHRRESDSAVAGHDGGDTVIARRFQQIVPADLAVVVGVDVHEAGRDDLAGGVDGFGGLGLQGRVPGPAPADLDDLAVLDTDVGGEPVGPGAVDDGPAGDQ